MIGGVLVIVIIFLFLRNIRSTLIICTSIPISVIGTFALLYFGGYTLNTMTFGGLALGIGMIVDAAIVVLENTYRHLEMGKDRMTAAIDGSEEVWSAILASTLTHIAVFVPMLFLTGMSSIMFGSWPRSSRSRWRCRCSWRSRSCRCSARGSSKRPITATAGRASSVRCIAAATASSKGWTTVYARALHVALATGRRCSPPASRCSSLALFLLPPSASNCSRRPTKARSRSTPSWRSARASSGPKRCCCRLEEAHPRARARGDDAHHLGAAAAAWAAAAAAATAATSTCVWCQRTSASARANEIAMALRRELSGLPGVIVRARPVGRPADARHARRRAGGDGSRFSRRNPRPRARRVEARRPGRQDAARFDPGIADSRVGREEGRPEIAVRVDRDKAAMLGLTVTGVANTIRTNLAGTQAAMFREGGNEYPIVVRLREEDRGEIAIGRRRADQHAAAARCCRRKNVMVTSREQGPVQIERKNQERIQRVNAEVETTLSEARRGGAGAAARDSACRRASRSASATKSRSRRSRSASCSSC